VIGSSETRLIILRGNSASGKSTIARRIRERLADKRVAIVSQDVIRREVLKEHDRPGAANIGLIEVITRYALDHDFHVVLDGIFFGSTYGEMLTQLAGEHHGQTHCYYLDIPFEETLLRHATKPKSSEYGEVEMRRWYHERDLVAGLKEMIILPPSTVEESVGMILQESGFLPPAVALAPRAT
jgi:predicted kinase